jgi:hypothetical protein
MLITNSFLSRVEGVELALPQTMPLICLVREGPKIIKPISGRNTQARITEEDRQAECYLPIIEIGEFV